MEKSDFIYMHLASDECLGCAENTYMELDKDRWQIKVIEIYKNNDVFWAFDNVENGTFLAEAQYPEPEEINGIPGYEGFFLEYIEKSEFYKIWSKNV